MIQVRASDLSNRGAYKKTRSILCLMLQGVIHFSLEEQFYNNIKAYLYL